MLLCRKFLDSPRLTIASENRHCAHIEIDRNGSPWFTIFARNLVKIRDFALEHVRAKYPRTLGALECYSMWFNLQTLWMKQPVEPMQSWHRTDVFDKLGRFGKISCEGLQILYYFLCEDKLNKLYDVQGVMLMVVGLPNVGKSTIINGLKQIGFGTARHTGKRIWARHLDPGDSSFDCKANAQEFLMFTQCA